MRIAAIMRFLSRESKLCLACMEYHMVYTVSIKGKECEYCFRSDSFLQQVTDNMTIDDLVL